MKFYTVNRQEYLTDPDGINRFNLKSLSSKPVYSKVQIGFPMNNLEYWHYAKLENYNINAQLRIVLIIYFFLGKLPKVNYKQHIFSKKYNYSILSTFTNKKQIYNFIFSFFIENRYRAHRDDKIFYRENSTANITALVHSPFFIVTHYLFTRVFSAIKPWSLILEIVFFIDNKNIDSLACRADHEFEVYYEEKDRKIEKIN